MIHIITLSGLPGAHGHERSAESWRMWNPALFATAVNANVLVPAALRCFSMGNFSPWMSFWGRCWRVSSSYATTVPVQWSVIHIVLPSKDDNPPGQELAASSKLLSSSTDVETSPSSSTEIVKALSLLG